MKSLIYAVVIGLLFAATNTLAQDQAQKIAAWIQSKVNTGGYNGASCRRLGESLVKCDMRFPAGTSSSTVIANTRGVAEFFAEVGRLAATIHYVGHSGARRVCEYKYNMYDATVTRVK